MKSKARWIPAKATLGQAALEQAHYVTQRLEVPAESSVAATSAGSPALVDNKTLLYGGVILAGLGLAWLVSRKA